MDENRELEQTVSKSVFSDVIHHDRWVIRRLIWALIAFVVLLFATNVIWIYFWNQYDYAGETITTTVDSDGEGIANYTGANGGVIVGKGDSSQTDDNPNETDRLEGDKDESQSPQEEVIDPA